MQKQTRDGFFKNHTPKQEQPSNESVPKKGKGFQYYFFASVVVFGLAISLLHAAQVTSSVINDDSEVQTSYAEYRGGQSGAYSNKVKDGVMVMGTMGGTGEWSGDFDRMVMMARRRNSPLDYHGIMGMWKKSVEAVINPAIPFCIALADSGLGTKGIGATTKNVGNVRPLGQTFPTYKEGLETIVRVLQQDQFENSNTIAMLSNAGRLASNLPPNCGSYDDSTKCWSTDTKYHLRNMLSCVQEIEDDFTITKDFRFK